ncbi:hypothetical protein Tco_0953683 [Tanacetum coccineum]|uniref:Uncharacterized protein n=1 Tax=Tanacetum coccineum TaxID=301880 RepID=A0ABQ5E350_9ASTR
MVTTCSDDREGGPSDSVWSQGRLSDDDFEGPMADGGVWEEGDTSLQAGDISSFSSTLSLGDNGEQCWVANSIALGDWCASVYTWRLRCTTPCDVERRPRELRSGSRHLEIIMIGCTDLEIKDCNSWGDFGYFVSLE